MKKLLAILVATMSILCFGLFTSGCNKKSADTIVIGITDYAPMDYEEDGVWKGFDYELSKLVFESLGYSVSFQEIDWDTKIMTLNSNEIDCIWNGMTITEELQANVTLSNVYLQNQQYGLVKKENAEIYKDQASLSGAKVAVESGSAANELFTTTQGENAVLCAQIIAQNNQNAAVLEVASGTADIAVVDYLLAKTLTAPGSSYANTLVAVDLGFEVEEFAVGFRKADVELCQKVNNKIEEFYADGTIKTLAEKYGIQNQLVK